MLTLTAGRVHSGPSSSFTDNPDRWQDDMVKVLIGASNQRLIVINWVSKLNGDLEDTAHVSAEYLASALYHDSPPEYGQALRVILNCLNSDTYSSVADSRELLDTGIRSAVKCGDRYNAVKLASLSKKFVRIVSSR